MPDENRSVLTVNEAAAIIQVTPRQVRNLITSGILKADRIGRDYTIRRADLKRLPERKRGPKPRARAK